MNCPKLSGMAVSFGVSRQEDQMLSLAQTEQLEQAIQVN